MLSSQYNALKVSGIKLMTMPPFLGHLLLLFHSPILFLCKLIKKLVETKKLEEIRRSYRQVLWKGKKAFWGQDGHRECLDEGMDKYFMEHPNIYLVHDERTYITAFIKQFFLILVFFFPSQKFFQFLKIWRRLGKFPEADPTHCMGMLVAIVWFTIFTINALSQKSFNDLELRVLNI